MTDAALYTTGGAVIVAVVGALGALFVQALKGKSDERTAAVAVLANTQAATHTELRALVEILREEANGAKEETRKARASETEMFMRLREASDLALRWEKERHVEYERAEEAEKERDEAREELARLEDIEERHKETRAQLDRLLDEWASERLRHTQEKITKDFQLAQHRDALGAKRDLETELGDLRALVALLRDEIRKLRGPG